MTKVTSPIPTDLVERWQHRLATCADSYEAPNGKIMFRIWANDLHELLKLARAGREATGVEHLQSQLTCMREALEPFAELAEWYDEREDDSFNVLEDYPVGWRVPQRVMLLKNFRKARAALKTMEQGE